MVCCALPLLVCTVLFGARASCGWHDATTVPLRHSNSTQPMPAMVESSDEEGVFGPPAPQPEEDDGTAVDLNGDLHPWEELMDVIGRLWSEGREILVYMLIYDLEIRHHEAPEDEVIEAALGAIRNYGDGVTRLLPTRWWTTWMDDLLRRWRVARWRQRHVRPRREPEETSLMQRSGTVTARRPAVWTRYLDQLAEYPEGVRAIVFQGLAAWLRQQVDDNGPRMCTYVRGHAEGCCL